MGCNVLKGVLPLICSCSLESQVAAAALSPTLLRMRCLHIKCPAQGHSSAAVQQVVRYLRKMCPSRGEGGFVLSTRPPLVLCAGNKLSSGFNEARNCKLSGEAQWRDNGLVFAGNVHEDESDMAESHVRMGVMIPPLLWRVMFNPFCLCIHLQIFLSPLICINTHRTLFNKIYQSVFFLLCSQSSLCCF